MKFISAATLILALASANALAEQSGSFTASQANYGNMISCSGGQLSKGPQHTAAEKSEQLGSPYYHGNADL
ncbi:multiple antibiotic resistance regulatory protein MarB [Cedecea sp. FDAARGOS_727]|uniref:multiple antibiotic resistance regulatory protein MarB n=1 Tax=Cedecea sp. FDAARGOS_727 TaxID=2545798 RepID=UPI00143EA4F2|nr:multiple antibiotic resistance regulatory protein MarB [Cedecea sp. FDAARGOS_727]QIX97800.1 multiple antibiotic resistance regulatory protein MarB [Cedecea sp. FDAARGOS_727]